MKPIKLLLLLFLFLNFFCKINGQVSSNDFVTMWQASDSMIHIPVSPNYTYNYDVDWDNDGVFDDIGVTDSISHKFNYGGNLSGFHSNTYTIRIRGNFPSIKFQKQFQASNVVEVVQWGNILIKDFSSAFKNTTHLEISATDAPNFDTTINISCEDAFRGVWQLSGLFNHWDMSGVTNMKGMFRGSAGFVSTIQFNSWDVSNVVNMESMFESCANLQADLSSWNVSSVTNMKNMFKSADYVIGDVSSWDVSSVTDMSGMFQLIDVFVNSSTLLDLSAWDVSSVTDMNNMFSNNSYSFSTLKNWDVSSVTNMQAMFTACREFDQNIGAWDISSVNNMANMFDVPSWRVSQGDGMSTANYDSTLIGWAQNVHQMNVNLGAGNLEYCMAINARNSLINDGWVITGDTTTCTTTSINEIGVHNMKVYPNPTSGIVRLEHLNFTDDVEVFSINGKLIRERIINSQIDLGNLKNGLYLIKLGNQVEKISLFKNQ